MSRDTGPVDRERGPRPGLIWTWVGLVLALGGVLVYSRWYAITILAKRAVSPAFRGAPALPVEMELVTLPEAREVRVRVTNVTSGVVPIELTQPTWNGAPMREKLPTALTLGPMESRGWVLHPIHPDAALYGTHTTAGVMYKSRSGNGGLYQLGGQDPTPSLRWDGSSIKLVQPLGRKAGRFCSIRNVRAALRGKALPLLRREGELVNAELVIARLATKPAKGTLVVKFEYRLTPWSPLTALTTYL